MRVLLPDSSELELPDGATGLDAARAIGPKLAEQAVLIRQNGNVQDLRLPLEDGQPIQILTTRDTSDPDALYVLRHSAAHLLAEAVRRLYPGVKIAIGPPIENGFYYDFEFPEPIREEDLEKIEAEILRELKEGRTWEREEISAEEAKRRFEAEGERYKVELVDTAEGEISLLHAGRVHRPLPRPAPAGLEADQGDQADLARGRLLARRREEHPADPDLRHRLLLAGRPRRATSSGSSRRRRATTAGSAASSTSSTSPRSRPGSPFWHPKGMVIWNALEDLRRRENARRGYSEVKTPLIYDTDVWVTSGHWEKFRENMFLVAGEGEEPHAALKPMNCPGHMLLFGSQLRSYRDLPIRYAESSTLHRNELAGALHGLLRVRHVTQDDAHIFCTEEQVPGEIDACIEFVKDLYALFGVTPHAELSTRPEERLGTDEEWDHAEGMLQAALERHGIEYVIGEGEGTFYAPKIDLHMRDTLGRSWQMGTIQADAQMPRRFGLTYMGPDNVEHTPVVIHRALLGSLERFIGIIVEHYGGVFPFWLAPVQVRLIPVGENHREAVQRAARAARGGGFPRRPRPARRDAREADPRGRAREDSVHDRLRRPRVGRVARGARTGRRAADDEPFRAARTVPGRACYDRAPERRSGPLPLTFPGRELARVQPSRLDEENVAAACSGFCRR